LVKVNERNGIIAHIFPKTKKAVVQFDKDKLTVELDECVKIITDKNVSEKVSILKDMLNERIIKVGNKWEVKAESGKSMGMYDTKEEAEKRLKQVEMFKHMKEFEDNNESIAPLKIEIDKKVEDFLIDHWTEFFNNEDAKNQIIKKFGIEDKDAEKYVRAMEGVKGNIESIYAMSESKLLENILYVHPKILKQGNKFIVQWVVRKSDKTLECMDRLFKNEVEAHTFMKQLQRDRIQEKINEDDETWEELHSSSYIKNLQWEEGDKGFDVYVKVYRNPKGGIDDISIIDMHIYGEEGDIKITPELDKYVREYINTIDRSVLEESKKSILKVEKCKLGLNESIKLMDSKTVDNNSDIHKVVECGKPIYFVSESKANDYVKYVNGGKYVNVFKYTGKVSIDESNKLIDIEFVDATDNKIDETIKILLKNKLNKQSFESFKIKRLDKQLIERKFIRNRLNEEFDIDNLKIRIYSALQNERKALGIWWYDTKTKRFEYSPLKGSAHNSDLFTKDVKSSNDSVRGRVFDIDGRNVLVIYPNENGKKLSEFDVNDIKYQCEQSGRINIDYVYDLGIEDIIESAVITKPQVGKLKESIEILNKQIVNLTAEKNKLIENYSKDIIRSTESIDVLEKEISGLNENINKLDVELKEEKLKNALLESNNKKRISELNETNSNKIRVTEELASKTLNELKQSFDIEKNKLVEKYEKDLVRQYAEIKTSLMGLRPTDNLKTLFESCQDRKSVDALIKQTQDAVREGILHYNKPSNLTIEKTGKNDPVAQRLQTMTAAALKSMGV